MRRAARTDGNQTSIIAALRRVGASVQVLSAVGDGCPDLLVGFRGINLALEVKDGSQPPSRRLLTPDERAWHRGWQGQVAVVESEAEALRVIGCDVR